MKHANEADQYGARQAMDEHEPLRDYDALERIPFFGPVLVDALDVMFAVPDCLRLRGLARSERFSPEPDAVTASEPVQQTPAAAPGTVADQDARQAA
jgi:hypothetical protein